MDFASIAAKVEEYRERGLNLFTTSSFQTHSLPLLHIISRIDASIPVVFINTGYYFPKTVKFKNEVASFMGLSVVDLRSDVPRVAQKGQDGRFLFASDPDHCCYLNKTAPMESWLRSHDVWINGIRADQSRERSAMEVEQNAKHGAVRFHPLLDWDSKMIWDYRCKYDLPEHPLDAKGYMSIGCEPCTRKIDPEMQEREVRWYGLNKVECGLHTDLISAPE